MSVQTSAPMAAPSAWQQLKANRNWLGFWFMLPAMLFLVLLTLGETSTGVTDVVFSSREILLYS